MSTYTVKATQCDRSGRYIKDNVREEADLKIIVPWIDLWEKDEYSFAFTDLCDQDRVVVAKLIARLVKADEHELLASCTAIGGGPLLEAVEKL